ncbi:uncharacterized protein LOC128987389 [Macrosteles quadrilineatus]|uniref:uncharacterized protein LOC128987389 n=1 Tax=Macrosteles quadrilineatus TaxID=74068 RepID=UPI0023E0F4FA|nr:uncharacterized protein LOC128987389 [Macrosteles quadrilineatus]
METWWWLLAAAVLAQLSQVLSAEEITQAPQQDIIVTLNTLRAISHTSDNFLGISISPKQLLNDGQYSVSTINMLRALSPGYLRVGGPESDNLSFKTLDNSLNAHLLTESQWENINQLAADTGLRLAFSLSPNSRTQSDLLRFSDIRGYDITWQLGYSTPKSNDSVVFSEESVEQITSLRRLVDSFPRYQNTVVLSPDLEFCEDNKDLEALKNFLQKTRDDFDFVILQMKPKESLKSIRNSFEKLDKYSSEIEKMAFNKNDMITAKISSKQKFWLVEAEEHRPTESLTDAMSCAMYLGQSSELGYHTLLLPLTQLSQPSPSYWTMLLYRALVGRSVLGSRRWPQTADVAVFASCTETKPHAALDTEWEYGTGAVTMWGVNSANHSSRIFLRAGWRVDYVHLYMMTSDDRGSILLNGQALRTVHGVLPRFSPHIRALSRTRSMTVTVPPRSVFFVVLPDALAPACLINTGEKLKNPLNNEEISPMALNIPIIPPKSSYDSQKEEMKPNNIFIEKGGVFTDIVEKDKGRTEDKSATKETTQNSALKTEKSEVKLSRNKDLNKLTTSLASNSLQNIPSLIHTKENNTGKISTEKAKEDFTVLGNFYPGRETNKLEEIQNKHSKDVNFSSKILFQENKSDTSKNDSSVKNDGVRISNDKTVATQVPRRKRSQDYEHHEKNPVKNTETSPLYRRVNLLRRILHRMQQPTEYEEEVKQQRLLNLASTAELMLDNNWRSSKTNSDYPVKIPSNEIKRQEQTGKVEQNKEVGNINYLPGEFYEILGGLKIDSNVSLKDKEDIIDTKDSLQKQTKPHRCRDDESKLIVTVKPENDPQEDRILVESATENSKKYYALKSSTSEQQIKPVEDYKIKLLNSKQIKFSKDVSDENISEYNERSKQEGFFKDLKKEENNSIRIEPLINRAKRKTKREDEDDDTFLMPIREKYESIVDSDYSDEVQLQRFLEDLTDESEQLVQIIDEEYESNNGISTLQADTVQLSTEPSVIHDKVKVAVAKVTDKPHLLNKTEETDYYLMNNIVIDKEVKPKRTYPPVNVESKMFSSFHKPTTTVRNIIVDNTNKSSSTRQPSGELFESQTDYSLGNHQTTSMELSTPTIPDNSYKNTNVSGESITEGISNSNMFIDSVPLGTDKTTKSGINIMSNKNLENYDANSMYRYNLTDNTTNEFKPMNKMNSYELYDMVEDTSEDNKRAPQNVNSSNLNEVKTEKSKSKPENIVPVRSVLLTKISDIITTTERDSFKDKSIDFVNLKDLYDVPGSIKHDETYSNNRKLINELGSNNQTKNLGKNLSNLVENTAPIEISDINSAQDNYDKKQKMNSESKLENKILPPPLKQTLIIKPLQTPPVITLNRNLTLSKKINDITNRILALNSKPKQPLPTLGKGSSLNTLLEKRQERLEAIKLKLQKARERLLNLTNPKITQDSSSNKQKQKREIIVSKDTLNSLLNGAKENKSEAQLQKNNMISTKKLKPSLDNLYLIHRLRRQIFDGEEIGSSSVMEEDCDRSRNGEEAEGYLKIQSPKNIITPYYFPEIKKWLIPLSNKTENILFKSKLVPVNLYGIVSDEWAQENLGKSPNTETKRLRRALRYPCVKDNFNDFEAEDESAKHARSFKTTPKKITLEKNTNAQSLPDTGKGSSSILSGILSTRSRRSTSRDIEMNEKEMKALLTNEIVKEKPSHDEPDHENVFSSMLHKTLTKTASNKTGIERMFELAKQYHETNPTSLEILPTKNKQTKKKKNLEKYVDKTSEENSAVELIDYTSSSTSRYYQTNITETIPINHSEKDFSVKNSSFVNSNSTKIFDEDKKAPGDEWSDFINQIQEFYESVTDAFKRGIPLV